MSLDTPDARLRLAAFAWLDRVTDGGDQPVTWNQLQSGFVFEGEAIVLIGAKGIWKPKQMRLPISIATTPPKASRQRPYEDHIADDGVLRYKYEGADPMMYRNVWMRECNRLQVPLIYFHGLERGRYVASWPAYITSDDPAALTVDVALSDPSRIRPDLSPTVADAAEQRFYTRLAKQRLEQATFRASVMRAYRESCCVCRLKHVELLDAAHIVSFAESGPSTVDNGLSLCKIHHAAYDHNIIGVSPTFELHLRQDLLDEIDGPMLRHGLQEVHGQRIVLPRRPSDQPRVDLLERRWEQFKLAG